MVIHFFLFFLPLVFFWSHNMHVRHRAYSFTHHISMQSDWSKLQIFYAYLMQIAWSWYNDVHQKQSHNIIHLIPFGIVFLFEIFNKLARVWLNFTKRMPYIQRKPFKNHICIGFCIRYKLKSITNCLMILVHLRYACEFRSFSLCALTSLNLQF